MEGRNLPDNTGRGRALPRSASGVPSIPYGSAAPRGLPGNPPQAEFEVDLPPLAPPVAPDLDPGESGVLEALQPGVPYPAAPPAGLDPRLWAGIPESLANLPPYAVSPRDLSPYPVPDGWGQRTHEDPPPATPAPSEVPLRANRAGDFVGDGDAPGPSRPGWSFAGVFGVAMLAQLALAVLVAGVVWAFPKECGGLVRRLAGRMELRTAGMLASDFPAARGGGADRLAILQLEDRALYRGDRAALERLRRMARDLEPADGEFDAVQASLIRVRQSFQLSQAEVPGPLDPREILPGVEAERDLPATAIVDVLRNRHQPVAARQRAAYLLKNERQSAAAQNALFHAIQDDPNLVVVRQAFLSFQELTGYPGRDFFDADAIDRWWARNSASFVGQRSEK